MSFHDRIWHHGKSRTYCSQQRIRRRHVVASRGGNSSSWIYVLYGLLVIGLVNFHATTTTTTTSMHHPGADHHNVAVTFCAASEVVNDNETTRVRLSPQQHSVRHRPSDGPHLTPKTALETSSSSSLTLNQIMYRAGKRGLGGGVPGAIAGAFQVVSLMWLRTIINYQSRYGTTFGQALRTLWNEGGIARLYCGVTFALVQAPLARFVSTAANDGVESLLANLSWTQSWGPGRTTVVASIVVGFWRMLLMRK
jgi:hypothetical protein